MDARTDFFLLSPRGIAYSRFSPVIVRAVQDLSDEVQALREENSRLKEKFTALEEKANAAAAEAVRCLEIAQGLFARLL